MKATDGDGHDQEGGADHASKVLPMVQEGNHERKVP
jgi:hypothetical protein